MPHGASTSSDLVLRCYAPQPVARAWLRASSAPGDCRERLNWGLGFVDVVQRFVLGVLASQHFGLGLEPTPALRRLVNKLATPSLGDFSVAVSEVAEALASALKDHKLDPSIAALVALFHGCSQDGAPRPAFVTNLRRLIDRRNHLFHRDGSPIPDEGTARRVLEEIQPQLRVVADSLRPLRNLPLLYVDSARETQDGTWKVELLRFGGQDPERLQLSLASRADVSTRVPFVLLANGDALQLPPFVVVARNRASGLPEARLLASWDGEAGALAYSDANGGERSVLEETEDRVTRAAQLLELTAKMMRRERAFPEDAIAKLQAAGSGQDLPRIEGFKLLGRLGTGASSSVFRAQELLHGRPPSEDVAVKLLHTAVLADPVTIRRLRREYEVLSKIVHPHIVKVRRFLDEQGPGIVMDYVDGADLQSQVAGKPLKIDEAFDIVEKVLEALAAAHACGIVHRDVKPSNILRTRRGEVQLIDFGIAAVDAAGTLTRTLDAVGTLGFAAPEQLRPGEHLVDVRADIFSVGRVLEFLLFGTILPDVSKTARVPDGIIAIIRKATQAEVAWRFQTAQEMLDAIRDRRRDRWAGAPVQEDDRLGDSYEVHDLKVAVAGLYLFGGAEIETDASVSIVVAGRGDSSTTRLREMWQGLSDSSRTALRYPRLLRTGDQLSFGVIDGELKIDVFRQWVGPTGEDAIAERVTSAGGLALSSMASPFVRGATQPLVVGAPGGLVGGVLGGIMGGARRQAEQPDVPGWIGALQTSLSDMATAIHRTPDRERLFFNMSRFLERALVLCLIQGEAIRGGRVARVVTRFRSPSEALREVTRNSVLGGALDAALLGRLIAIVRQRNQVAHGLFPVQLQTQELEETLRALADLLDALMLLARLIKDPSRLAPAIAQVGETATWAMIEGRGTKAEYVALDGVSGSFPLTAEAVEWLAREGLGVTNRAVMDERVVLLAGFEASVEAQLRGMPGVGDVLIHERAAYAGRNRRANFVVVSTSGARLAVVDCTMGETAGMRRVQTLDALWMAARAFEVAIAAHVIDSTWTWYDVDVVKGLIERPGPPESWHEVPPR